jgi:methionyl-tRNA formyltransferase
VTLHKVDAGIDTGPILRDVTFPIGHQWTARMVHDHAQAWAAYVFATWWADLLDGVDGVLTAYSQRGTAGYYRRDSLDVYRKLADHPPEMHDRIRRALTFPPFPMPEEP